MQRLWYCLFLREIGIINEHRNDGNVRTLQRRFDFDPDEIIAFTQAFGLLDPTAPDHGNERVAPCNLLIKNVPEVRAERDVIDIREQAITTKVAFKL